MLSRLFSFSPSKSRPSGPANSRAYAIGDVHGRLDLLRQLVASIEADNARRAPAKTYLVMLGDLIDRGPDSKGVIDYLTATPPNFARLICLKGNHEEFFLNVLEGKEEKLAGWLAYGGSECAESYGISTGWTLNASTGEIMARLFEAVPEHHREFFNGMHDTFKFGDYLFVHAGIRPGVELTEQTSQDLRWIREGFLEDRTDHGLIVVHGHTIVPEPDERPNRIAIDTGAYRSGVLTAIGLEGTERWFIEARD